jgi:hypothetical protein
MILHMKSKTVLDTAQGFRKLARLILMTVFLTNGYWKISPILMLLHLHMNTHTDQTPKIRNHNQGPLGAGRIRLRLRRILAAQDPLPGGHPVRRLPGNGSQYPQQYAHHPVLEDLSLLADRDKLLENSRKRSSPQKLLPLVVRVNWSVWNFSQMRVPVTAFAQTMPDTTRVG